MYVQNIDNANQLQTMSELLGNKTYLIQYKKKT